MFGLIIGGILLLLIGLFIGTKIIKYKIEKINIPIREENEELKEINRVTKNLYLQIVEQDKKYSLETQEKINKLKQEKAIIEEQIKSEKEKKDIIVQEHYNQELLKINYNIKTHRENADKIISDLKKEAEQDKLKIADEIFNLAQKRNAIIQISKEEERMRNEKDFFRLVLSNADLEDILRLKEIEPFLHNVDVLNKTIYKVYFEKPLTSLVGRVVGSAQRTGIYKITNIENGMCYIGQATNIADRWKQHIKRALGAESMTQNKLYPVMKEVGVYNFTFQIVEECGKEKLNEREQYWQNFYGAKEFGYSIK